MSLEKTVRTHQWELFQARLNLFLSPSGRRDRGDVPGWVMVTLMSAILVIFLIAGIKNPLRDAVTSAINKVANDN